MMLRAVLTIALLAVSAQLHAACEHNYSVNAGATVKDGGSGLLWSRCLLGQPGGDCAGDALSMSWVDALNQARGSELGGITNWRMPKIEEIEQLFVIKPDCLAEMFPGFGGALIWSASANIDYATDAWAFEVEAGKRAVYARDSKLQVLLVAGPK